MGLFCEGFLQCVQRAGADVAVYDTKGSESECSRANLRPMTMSCVSMVLFIVAVTMGIPLVMCLGERLCVLGSY
jgi:hypothetical protein